MYWCKKQLGASAAARAPSVKSRVQKAELGGAAVGSRTRTTANIHSIDTCMNCLPPQHRCDRSNFFIIADCISHCFQISNSVFIQIRDLINNATAHFASLCQDLRMLISTVHTAAVLSKNRVFSAKMLLRRDMTYGQLPPRRKPSVVNTARHQLKVHQSTNVLVLQYRQTFRHYQGRGQSRVTGSINELSIRPLTTSIM